MAARTNTVPRLIGLVLGGLVVASSLLYVACDDSGTVRDPAPVPPVGLLPDGAPIPDAGLDGTLPDGAPSDCVQNPQTHAEIINGCTDAVKITKNPTLPRLYADGGLPPLQ